MKKILLLLSIFFVTPSFGQNPFWVQTNGPSAGPSSMAFNSKGDIFDLDHYLLRSTDQGTSWVDITPNPLISEIYSWVIWRDILFLYCANNFLYRSIDDGNSWKLLETPTPEAGYIFSSESNTIFLYGNNRLLRSLDSGNKWKDLSANIPSFPTASNTWPSVTVTGELFYQGDQVNYLYFSQNNGDSWVKRSTLPYRLQSGIQSTSNGYLFSTAIYDSATDIFGTRGIRSEDNGLTWDTLPYFPSIVTSKDIITISDDSLVYSDDYGDSWKKDFYPDWIFLQGQVEFYADQNINVYTSSNIRTAMLNMATGVSAETPIPIADVSNLLAYGEDTLFASNGTYVSRSTNRGKTWASLMNIETLTPSCTDSTGTIVGLLYGGFSYSSDGGVTWKVETLFEPSPNYGPPTGIATAPNGDLFFEAPGNIIHYTSNYGSTWEVMNVPSDNSGSITWDKFGTMYIFSLRKVYNSTDNGNSWQIILDLGTFVPDSTIYITSLVVTQQSEIFIGASRSGILLSKDFGVHWSFANENLVNEYITSLFSDPNGDVYAFTMSGPGGIVYRPYNGTRWYSANSGLKYPNIATTMAFAPDGTAYLGRNGEGVWRSQGAINAISKPIENNTSISVSPNPATNRITISYSLNESEYINLGIYDALGRTLMTFAPSVQNAGEHSANAELGNLPDGIYFVRLATPYSSAAQKIIIAK